MSSSKLIKLKYTYLLAEFRVSRKTETAIALAEMLASSEIVGRPGHDHEWKFFPVSRYKCKCQGCGIYYSAGHSGVYVLDGKGWHDECAPAEAKEATAKMRANYDAKLARAKQESDFENE